MESPYIVEVENLTKKFRDFTAVDNITFAVRQGEIFGFLGPNGAGKTTTINILCTLLKPTGGRAHLNGFDIMREQTQVRQSIGLVFQDPSLDERLTAAENLRFHAYLYDVPAAEREGRIQEVLRLVELWERRNDLVRHFSGGMKRRLEIARGLLHYPRVLFLDEPTLGLDPQTRNRIWEYILELRQQKGITIFLTTHYMDEAENADRIAVIDHGKIIALNTPENLKSLVGGDIIILKTTDDDEAAREVQERFGLAVQRDGNGLLFEVLDGEGFIPRLVGGLSIKINSISLRRPTLDDVFLKLTGREIRDESADAMAGVRSFMQRHRGFRH